MLLTRFRGLPEPLFRPQFLGEKYPTLDFLVELTGVTAPIVPYFFVQAKATSVGYTKRQNNLKIKVSTRDMARLVSYPAPTYIIGIDERREEGYIVAAIPGGPDRLSSMSTQYPLDRATLQALYDEVLQFWQANGAPFGVSRFV
jgi:hypothetical protein